MSVATNGSEPARILVIFGNVPLLGQERGNIQALQTLQETGHEVLFVTNDEYGHESIQPALDRRGLAWTTGRYPGFFPLGPSLTKWRTWGRDWVQGNRDFLRAARAFRPTHIHAGNERFLLNLLPAVRLLGLPVVFRIGDEPRLHHAAFRLLWRVFLIPTVCQFVAVSEFIERRLYEAGASEEQVRVIYSHPSERPSAKAKALVEPFEGTTVVYMGQLQSHKGVDLLVEAALDLCRARDDVRFLLAGDYSWNNEFAKELIARVEASEVSDRIRFLGFVDDMSNLLAEADVHVCPSVWEEPLSNTLVEAKQAGLPSVVFPSGGLPELVRHKGDGFVCRAKTAEALREGVEHYLDAGASAAEAAGERARASLEQFGIDKASFRKKWVEVYADASAVGRD